ncbi:MAG: hypothetical protein WD154_03500, partial [Nitrosopumilaceae archaeon]
MAKRHTQEQELLIQYFQSTYLDKEKVLARDLAVINKSEIFPDDHKKDRRYNRAILHAKEELKLLLFFLHNMKPRYRNKIVLSEEFNGVIHKMFDIQGFGLSDQTELEKKQAIAFALQMLEY